MCQANEGVIFAKLIGAIADALRPTLSLVLAPSKFS